VTGVSSLAAAVAGALAAMSWLEIASVAFALAYLVLAVRQNILCWPAALISTLLSLALFFDARLYPETALQIFYAVMAVYGWYQWRHGGRPGGSPGERVVSELPVSVWPLSRHALAVGGTLAAALALGTVLSRTNAAFPYLDSFTSVGAVVTTYMVAKKVLENWVYWLVIDGITLYIYWQRSLYLYAALFVVYLVLVVVGFYRWHRDWRAQPALAA
jgi:nicotinamide mononucleotide transporter